MGKGHYTITLNHERGLVCVLAQGEFDYNSGGELITDARQQAAEHQYDIFCDVRESSAKVNLVDWFYLPRRLFVYNDWKTRTASAAILVSAGKQEKAYRFFETVASNIGLQIKIFLDEEEALAWLGGIKKN
jgi:hypothetical protein